MLPGLVFLTSLLCFSVVVLWIIMCDGPGIEGGHTGLLAMVKPPETPEDPDKKAVEESENVEEQPNRPRRGRHLKTGT